MGFTVLNNCLRWMRQPYFGNVCLPVHTLLRKKRKYQVISEKTERRDWLCFLELMLLVISSWKILAKNPRALKDIWIACGFPRRFGKRKRVYFQPSLERFFSNMVEGPAEDPVPSTTYLTKKVRNFFNFIYCNLSWD